jgi:tyrosine decarboxylase/aspartate 1-decarboxylase
LRKPDSENTDILEELEQRLSGDQIFAPEGKIIGSMCSSPMDLAKEAFLRYINQNLGDPGLVPGLVELEKESISILGDFLHCPGATGQLVSGGSEANILALWTAREEARARGRDAREIILPSTAHFSFDKAASLMDLKLIRFPVEAHGEYDPREISSRISENTLAIVAVAGTTGLGATDPIPEISAIALEKNLYFHVDAAFGGFILPFLEEAGYPSKSFDFENPGVRSITIDPHKMGRSPIPGGCILYRNSTDRQQIHIEAPYLSGGGVSQSSIVGTRSGAAVAALWTVLKKLKRPGFVDLARESMEKTHLLKGELEKRRGVKLVREPLINILGITFPTRDVEEAFHHFQNRGWAVSLWKPYLRLVMMPHVGMDMMKRFLRELDEFLGE